MTIPIRSANCPPGLEYLTTIDKLLVKQRVTVFELNNKFKIKNALGQNVSVFSSVFAALIDNMSILNSYQNIRSKTQVVGIAFYIVIRLILIRFIGQMTMLIWLANVVSEITVHSM